ncbi:MAG: lipocalin-like domain-containing protein [Nevskia sp.]|nr:lipocalin-like domain-containing protein [Nevskia sp.]
MNLLRPLLACLAPLLLVLSACAAPAPTTDAAPDDATVHLRSRLIGAWKLVAIRDRDVTAGTETPAARAADGGQLIYTANGRLSVQIVRVGRAQAPPGSADGFSSYFGRWELVPAEGCVIHHQDGNLAVAQVGQAAKRYYSFDPEGHLSLATPPRKREDGHDVSSVFVWEKYP